MKREFLRRRSLAGQKGASDMMMIGACGGIIVFCYILLQVLDVFKGQRMATIAERERLQYEERQASLKMYKTKLEAPVGNALAQKYR